MLTTVQVAKFHRHSWPVGGKYMNMESGSSQTNTPLSEPLPERGKASGAPAVTSASTGSLAKIANVLNTKITATDIATVLNTKITATDIATVLNTKITAPDIANVLTTKITLPTLPKRLVADIHLHERLAKQKEALTFLSSHDAITHGNVQLAAELINETLSKVMENEYNGVWLLNDSRDKMEVVDEYVTSRRVHDPVDEYARADFPSWFENLMTETHIVACNEMEMFNVKPEFFEENQRWGIRSGLETAIRVYGEDDRVIGLLQSDDNQDREFFDDEITFHRQMANLFAAAVHNEQYHLLEIQIHKKEKHIERQRETLRDIMDLKALNDGDIKATFDFICEKIIELYDADGCTIWQAINTTNKLTCISSADKKDGHLTDLHQYDIDQHDTPIYFDVIASGRCFAVEDVSQDMHLSELFYQQIQPAGTVSVLDMGVFHYKKLMGSICIDSSTKRKWDNGDKLFLTEVTELICECILNKQNKHLESQLRILSTAIEHSPCAIFAINADQHIQYCNAHFEQWMGVGKSALLGSHMNQLKLAEASVVEFGRMVTAVSNGKAWQGKLEFVGQHGISRVTNVSATPIFDEHSAVSEFIFFCE